MKKRFLAALLVLVMAISVLPFSAAAKGFGDHSDKNKTCSVEHNWLFLGNSGTCAECGKENVKCNNHVINWLEPGKTLTIEPDCINEGYVITYRICKKCNAAVGTRQFNAPVTDHDWSAKDGICGVCGTECEHENWTGTVCDECAFECTSHRWNVDTCTVCSTVCEDHNWNKGMEKSECTICDAECEHEAWTANVCNTCKYTCTHASEGEDLTETVVEATCLKNGKLKKYKVCDHCEQEYAVKYELIRAGHTWENGKCTKCPAKCLHIPNYLDPQTKVVEPTCTERGYSVRYHNCLVCGFDLEFGRKYDYVEATGHTWESNAEGGVCSDCEATHAHELDEGTTVTQATCTVDGEGVKACQVPGCEYDETYVINKTGHSWKVVREGFYTYSKCEKCPARCNQHTIGEDGKCTTCGQGCTHQAVGNKVQMKYVPATCTEKGYYEWYKICKHCGEKYDVTKVNGHAPATGHKWVDAKDSEARVCRVNGCDAKCEEHTWRYGFCTNCGKRCRHPESMQNEEVTKAATCEEKGIKTITCECGKLIDIDEIPMAEHKFENGVCTECGENEEECNHPQSKLTKDVRKATCESDGYVIVTCECGAEVDKEELLAEGHSYKVVDEKIGNCTNPGYIWKECINCGKKIEGETDVVANGHEYSAGKCGICGADQPNYVAPCAHEYHTDVIEATCVSAGSTYQLCKKCGHEVTTTIPAKGHDHHETIVKNPTCSAKGQKVITCSRCNYNVPADIDALNHHYGSDGVCTRTGCQHADESKWTLDLFGYHIVGNAGK